MVIGGWYESIEIKPGSPMPLIKWSISSCLFLLWYKAKPHNKCSDGCYHRGSNQQNPLYEIAMQWNCETCPRLENVKAGNLPYGVI